MEHGTRSKYVADKCRCDECRKANADYKRRYRKLNPDKIAASEAKRRDETRRRTSLHRAANPDLYRRYARESYERDRAVYLQRASDRRKTEAGKATARTQRERRRSAPLTPAALEYIEVIKNDPCVYCGERSESIDHIQPIALGGTGEWDNLAASCRSCNSQKHTKTLLIHLLRTPRPQEGTCQNRQ